MEAKEIYERIKDVSLLQKDNSADWSSILKVFPYFSAAHLLKTGCDFFHNEDSISIAALQKQNPIKFAAFIEQVKHIKKITESAEVITISELPETTSTVVLEEKPEEMSKKDVQQVIENKPQEVIVEKIQEAEQPVIEVPVMKTEAKNDLITAVIEPIKTEPQNQSASEDVLGLINELPEVSAFELPEFKESKKEALPVLVAETAIPTSVNNAISDEDKSLMVMMSFTEWLFHFKQKTATEKSEAKERKALKTAWQKEKLAEAADEELDEIPEPIFKLAMDSISTESGLISESLAEILAKQGKNDKAIAMYKKLSLRNPEKSSFFATRIQELNLNNE